MYSFADTKTLPPIPFKTKASSDHDGDPFSGHFMTAIDRTAYPRLSARLTRQELDARYALTDSDLTFVRESTRAESGRLMMATLLKTRQDFGCFPTREEIHLDTVAHLAPQLGLTVSAWPKEAHGTKSFYRYQAKVRSRLSVTPYGDAAE